MLFDERKKMKKKKKIIAIERNSEIPGWGS
jgi:hypothetical protein